ncbi:helix-turn-helix transcriptional regulator [uncultured Bacteroides sp.]|uniref:helix-turn-helix domain-containing protein n=1 Tax=uncultured Bacteroides sp. TaxID=162156 RepID=UPI0025FE3F9E|nr:helix-turn-helix transcriptional regulator [uncultured Bacteroides sp.]
MSDFVTRYIIMLFSASAILAVSVILLMLSVPLTGEWKNFRTVRLCLAFTCLVLSASDFVSCFAMDSNQEAQLFSTLTLIVASYQAMLFTTASLVFVQSARVHRRSVLTQLGVITAAGVSLLVSQYHFPRLFAFLFAAAIAAYIAQIVFYTLAFRKDYMSCVEHLEAFYDEDEQGRMRWISRCFYSALAVGIVALFFCMIPYSSITYDLFVLTYTIYYVYIAGCVVNYRIKAGFIINARREHQQEQEEKQAIPKTEEVAAEEETAPQTVLDWADKLRIALERWVAEKKFIETDSNPDKVAKELGTTKSLLNCYFAKYEHITFREWRTRLRIKEAERILREEDVVLPALHELVGVSDKSNFHKHFKQLTGMTPNEYRKQVRK